MQVINTNLPKVATTAALPLFVLPPVSVSEPLIRIAAPRALSLSGGVSFPQPELWLVTAHEPCVELEARHVGDSQP